MSRLATELKPWDRAELSDAQREHERRQLSEDEHDPAPCWCCCPSCRSGEVGWA